MVSPAIASGSLKNLLIVLLFQSQVSLQHNYAAFLNVILIPAQVEGLVKICDSKNGQEECALLPATGL